MATVSDRAWSQFSAIEYTPEQWRRAALVDTGDGDPGGKGRYRVAVREPDGVLNRGAVLEAAGDRGLGAVQGITDEVRKRAARELMGMFKTIGEDPPGSLMDMAGMEAARSDTPTRETMYRAFYPDLHVRAGDGTGRTIYGIAVPYNAPVAIESDNFNGVEQFARGAFNHQLNSPNRVKLAREHELLGGEMIGVATLLRDDAAGLYVEMRVSRTPTGDNTLELVRDGALDELSIMFRSRRDRQLAGGIIERVKADLSEVAVVRQGAYGELATAMGIRSARGMPMATDELDLRAAAQEFLTPGALPPAPNHDLQIRMLDLGIPLP